MQNIASKANLSIEINDIFTNEKCKASNYHIAHVANALPEWVRWNFKHRCQAVNVLAWLFLFCPSHHNRTSI